jgi:hypothetical protein
MIPPTPTAPRATMIIVSSRNRLRTIGATAFADIVAIDASETAKPNHTVPAF